MSLVTALVAWGLAAPAAVASVQSELAFHRGVVAFGDGLYDAARESFEKVLAEDPEDAAAIQYLGLIAQEQKDFDRAVTYFDRALVLEPDNTDLRLDRGAALLETGRIEEARAAIDEVLVARPDDPRANLFAGIVAYRSGEYEQAIERFDRAQALDPSLEAHATYYAGLSAAFLGNFADAAGAFSAVEEQSPLSPLSRSAGALRRQVTAEKPEERRNWSLAITAGIEWDDNPTFAGTSDLMDKSDDFRGVFRLRGHYQLLDMERFSLTAGYDAYLSAHHTTDNLDMQTHVPWLSATLDFDPVRFGLRYDYAYTMIDIADKFRSLHRITPSVTYRESDWGMLQVFLQWQNSDFLRNPPHPFDRDSNRYTAGFNQFFFLPRFLTYLRIGALGEADRADSTDFSYDGFEVSAGGGADLPFGIQLTTLYRFVYRDYRSMNVLKRDRDWLYTKPSSWRFVQREDYVHRVSIEMARPIGEHIEASVASSLDFTDSNIDFYDYDRAVVGACLSYRF
jgi:tetratricopeptide (TPR) repeat protein